MKKAYQKNVSKEMKNKTKNKSIYMNIVFNIMYWKRYKKKKMTKCYLESLQQITFNFYKFFDKIWYISILRSMCCEWWLILMHYHIYYNFSDGECKMLIRSHIVIMVILLKNKIYHFPVAWELKHWPNFSIDDVWWCIFK